MEIKCIIGIVMIAAIFFAPFALIGIIDSWKIRVGVFLAAVGILGWVALAVYFLSHC